MKNIMAQIYSNDRYEKREIQIYYFESEDLFDLSILNVYNKKGDYSFNCIIKTKDNKILLLRRKYSFEFDKINYISKKDKLITQNKFISIIKNLKSIELKLIKIIIEDLIQGIDSNTISKNLFTTLKDKNYIKDLLKVGNFIIQNQFESIFFEQYKKYYSINEYIQRELKIRTSKKNHTLLFKKKNDLYILPGGKKSKKDTTLEKTVIRETYEELGKNTNFLLTFDKHNIIKTKIYDKILKKYFNDITLICEIDKNSYELEKTFKINKEISSIKFCDLNLKENIYENICVNYLTTILNVIN